jgi:hypothetical protein
MKEVCSPLNRPKEPQASNPGNCRPAPARSATRTNMVQVKSAVTPCRRATFPTPIHSPQPVERAGRSALRGTRTNEPSCRECAGGENSKRPAAPRPAAVVPPGTPRPGRGVPFREVAMTDDSQL